MHVKMLLIAALLQGCATLRTETPSWIAVGSGAFNESGGRFFIGVGTGSNITRDELRRMMAEATARSELGKVLNTFMQELLASFPTPHPGLEREEDASPPQLPLKLLLDEQLKAAVVTDRWTSPDGRTDSVRVRLSIDGFMAALAARSDIPEKARARMAAKARRMGSEMGIDSVPTETAPGRP